MESKKMKFKEFFSKNNLIKILYLFINVGMLLGTIAFLLWGGLKGVVGLAIGISYMTVALKQQSPMLMFVVKQFGSDWYTKELDNTANKKPKKVLSINEWKKREKENKQKG